ncbi:universal stress protein [Halostagnicola kamekurae]|uniref:Nucleotide-binding universal stress protein, UspA family n=1 Tax=Halostagnicola kamekurae TaxID=619731 RepID=A0A1I6QY22_9EURY|nr:universal stress protein [Halostagnicola kamekurae]SFS57387.1 Nucleotide-binding universal stress protein, UspA family [Halostagnicola kamekurae]
MYDDILVPTDGSDTVSETLAHALPIATDNDATVHGLYVVDTRITTAATDDTRTDLEESLESDGTVAIEAIERAADEREIDVTTALERGIPSKTILEYADERNIDLIVIGTHGKSPREKIVSLGSVSERVVDNASIPVLVVRDV